MTLPSKTQQQLVDDQVAAWSAATGVSPIFSSGDMLLAIFQATGSQLDFLQALVALLVKLTRASSSTGPDLDSWMADFGFPREPATAAEGVETLGKNAAAATAIVVSPGAVVQTQGGTVQYQVVADANQAAWSASATQDSAGNPIGGYVLLAGQTSMNVTVQALAAGSASNVIQGTLSQPGTQIAGIDTFTNPTAISNGADAESDEAYRARFVLFMQTLAKGTYAAIQTAISAVQQNLTDVLLENRNPTGATQLGAFTAVVDDGSGTPSQTVLDSVATAVDAVRAFTIQSYIVPPQLVLLTISLNVRVAAGYTANNVIAAATAAVVAQVGGLTTGQTAFVGQIEGAVEAVQGVVSVEPGYTTINGVQADFVPTVVERVTTQLALVTAGTY